MAAVMRRLFATMTFGRMLVERLCALCLLSACQATPPTSDATQPVSAEAQWQRPQALIVAKQPDAPMLDIGVVLFDPGVAPEDDSPEATVRRLEASASPRAQNRAERAINGGLSVGARGLSVDASVTSSCAVGRA